MFISHLHEQHNSSLRIIPFALLLGKKKNNQPTNQKKNKQTKKTLYYQQKFLKFQKGISRSLNICSYPLDISHKEGSLGPSSILGIYISLLMSLFCLHRTHTLKNFVFQSAILGLQTLYSGKYSISISRTNTPIFLSLLKALKPNEIRKAMQTVATQSYQGADYLQVLRFHRLISC